MPNDRPNDMRASAWRVSAACALILLVGCSAESRSPDAIREKTADATAATTRDAKAVAQGVFEGLRRKGPLNINTATRAELLTLPDLTPEQADAIIAGRPYRSSTELLHRRVLPRKEYTKIASHVVARER